MTTEDTRCPSCGILYTQHYGLNMTCKDLMEARAEVERLREQDAALRMIADAAVTEMDGWQERAEAAEAERDRYKAALVESCDNMRAEGPYEGMGICPQLQEVTAERDQYRDIIQQVAGTGQVMGYPHCRCGRCVACLCREALEVKP